MAGYLCSSLRKQPFRSTSCLFSALSGWDKFWICFERIGNLLRGYPEVHVCHQSDKLSFYLELRVSTEILGISAFAFVAALCYVAQAELVL